MTDASPTGTRPTRCHSTVRRAPNRAFASVEILARTARAIRTSAS